MKRYKLKPWLKSTLMIMVISIVSIGIITINNAATNEFMNNCESAGYSHNYCISQK